tara:strand:+ start:442 stop:636 length:195 start_codon:yes stop_codon:yes gene_type:complete
MNKTAAKIAGAFLFLYLLGYMGEQDFFDEQREFAFYCEHVFGPNPIWPDYKNVGLEICQEELEK